MKWSYSSLLLPLLISKRASASPFYSSNGFQTVLSGVVEHVDDFSGLLDDVKEDIVDFMNGLHDTIGRDTRKPIKEVKGPERVWSTEDGRRFVQQHGTTCKFRAPMVLVRYLVCYR